MFRAKKSYISLATKTYLLAYSATTTSTATRSWRWSTPSSQYPNPTPSRSSPSWTISSASTPSSSTSTTASSSSRSKSGTCCAPPTYPRPHSAQYRQWSSPLLGRLQPRLQPAPVPVAAPEQQAGCRGHGFAREEDVTLCQSYWVGELSKLSFY